MRFREDGSFQDFVRRSLHKIWKWWFCWLNAILKMLHLISKLSHSSLLECLRNRNQLPCPPFRCRWTPVKRPVTIPATKLTRPCYWRSCVVRSGCYCCCVSGWPESNRCLRAVPPTWQTVCVPSPPAVVAGTGPIRIQNKHELSEVKLIS